MNPENKDRSVDYSGGFVTAVNFCALVVVGSIFVIYQ